MAHKFSNRERIHRRALEAEIDAQESAEREAAKAASAGRRRKDSPASARVKLAWRIYAPQYKEIATFPFKERAQADAEAARLTEKTGKPHVVKSVRVPVAKD